MVPWFTGAERGADALQRLHMAESHVAMSEQACEKFPALLILVCNRLARPFLSQLSKGFASLLSVCVLSDFSPLHLIFAKVGREDGRKKQRKYFQNFCFHWCITCKLWRALVGMYLLKVNSSMTVQPITKKQMIAYHCRVHSAVMNLGANCNIY